MTTGLTVIITVMAVTTVGYYWWQRREGVVRRIEDPAGVLSSEKIGGKRGYRATYVQFSTPMCAKCPGTRVLLQSVAAEYKGVNHVEIDAAERLDMAKEFDIMRTPTTLVLNHEGVVVARMSGAPSDAQAREALTAAPPPSADYVI